MQLVQKIAVNSDCYRANKYITPQGIVIHSVGCPQPNAEVFANTWNKPGQKACVHAVLDAQGNVIQCLPWNMRGWHVGGTGNNTHIGVEMTEPKTIKYTGGATWVELEDGVNTASHVLGTYKTAVELFAYLCKEYKLDPLKDGVIISHHEAHLRGLGSNHGDVEHIWHKLGYTMEKFRNDIKAKMSEVESPQTVIENKEESAEGAASSSSSSSSNSLIVNETSDTDRIWNYLIEKIGNAKGVAGLMGNIQAESGFKSNNLQNTYNKSFGVEDSVYTEQVDRGQRGFIDKAGYGLCQWTSDGRKEGLYNLCKNRGKSVSDLDTQLDWLWVELTNSYRGVLEVLRSATSVKQASDKVITGFERPRDQSESVKEYRAGLSQDIYNRYMHGKTETTQTSSTNPQPQPSQPQNTQPSEVKYVVRLSYEDKASQIGAYNVLNNAILRVEETTPYKIYSRSSGKLLYESCHSKFGRPKPFKVKVVKRINARVEPNGKIASVLEPKEYTVEITYSQWGLVIGYGWINLAYVEIEDLDTENDEIVSEESGIEFTDKEGSSTIFTEEEWETLIGMWVYTGKAEEIIKEHTIQELRTMLNNNSSR